MGGVAVIDSASGNLGIQKGLNFARGKSRTIEKYCVRNYVARTEVSPIRSLSLVVWSENHRNHHDENRDRDYEGLRNGFRIH